MTRRLLNLLTPVSLLLCVAAAAMWARSYLMIETLVYQPRTSGYSLASSHGDAAFKRVRDQAPDVRRWRYYAHSARTGRYRMSRDNRRYPGGFWWETGRINGNLDGNGKLITYPYASLIVPYWSLVAATAALPAARLALRIRRRRRTAPGHCPACGYNLTGNTSGVCPECGTIATLEAMR